VFDGLAHPHSWFPYVQIGFNMHLYIKVLFSRESLDFRPKSHDICRNFELSMYRINDLKVRSASYQIKDLYELFTISERPRD
jgi:hypothetical protein